MKLGEVLADGKYPDLKVRVCHLIDSMFWGAGGDLPYVAQDVVKTLEDELNYDENEVITGRQLQLACAAADLNDEQIDIIMKYADALKEP